jgi:hypothetical protein
LGPQLPRSACGTTAWDAGRFPFQRIPASITGLDRDFKKKKINTFSADQSNDYKDYLQRNERAVEGHDYRSCGTDRKTHPKHRGVFFEGFEVGNQGEIALHFGT